VTTDRTPAAAPNSSAGRGEPPRDGAGEEQEEDPGVARGTPQGSVTDSQDPVLRQRPTGRAPPPPRKHFALHANVSVRMHFDQN